MARIFISHSNHDHALAGEFFVWLKSRGFGGGGFPDIDRYNAIPPDERWDLTLYDDLERAHVVVLILTKNWFDCQQCLAEFAKARSHGKAIFPVIVSRDGVAFVGDDLRILDLMRGREGGRALHRLVEDAQFPQNSFDFPAERDPYPSFRVANEDDAVDYLSRDDDVSRLIHQRSDFNPRLLPVRIGEIEQGPARFRADEAIRIEDSDTEKTKRNDRGEERQDEEHPQAMDATRLGETESELDAERHLRRRTNIVAAVLGIVALVSAGAGVLAMRLEDRAVELAKVAEKQRASAEIEAEHATRKFDAAKSTVDQLSIEIAQGLRRVGGIPVESIRAVLSRVEGTTQRLSVVAPDDTDVQRSRAVMMREFGETYMAAGDRLAAHAAFEESLAISRRLVDANPGNTEWQREVSQSLLRLGALLHAGDAAEALAAYQWSLAISRRLAGIDPGNAEWQRDMSQSLSRIGTMKLQSGDATGALAAFEEDLVIRRRLAEIDPGNSEWQRGMAQSLSRTGAMKLQSGDATGALAAFEEDLVIRRWLAGIDPGNAEWQREMAQSLGRIGAIKLEAGDTTGALAAFKESLVVRRRVVDIHPQNEQWQRELKVSLNQLSFVEFLVAPFGGAHPATLTVPSLDPAQRWTKSNLAHAFTQWSGPLVRLVVGWQGIEPNADNPQRIAGETGEEWRDRCRRDYRTWDAETETVVRYNSNGYRVKCPYEP